MKKDFSAIREMANKKLLNGEQKKNLHKLFESKINIRIAEQKGKDGVNYAEAEKNFLKKMASMSNVKKLMNDLDQADKTKEHAEKELNKIGLEYENKHYSDTKGRELDTCGGANDPSVLRTLREKQQDKVCKMEELKLELLANLHGLPMTYAEMTEYIDNEIAKI